MVAAAFVSHRSLPQVGRLLLLLSFPFSEPLLCGTVLRRWLLNSCTFQSAELIKSLYVINILTGSAKCWEVDSVCGEEEPFDYSMHRVRASLHFCAKHLFGWPALTLPFPRKRQKDGKSDKLYSKPALGWVCGSISAIVSKTEHACLWLILYTITSLSTA